MMIKKMARQDLNSKIKDETFCQGYQVRHLLLYTKEAVECKIFFRKCLFWIRILVLLSKQNN